MIKVTLLHKPFYSRLWPEVLDVSVAYAVCLLKSPSALGFCLLRRMLLNVHLYNFVFFSKTKLLTTPPILGNAQISFLTLG